MFSWRALALQTCRQLMYESLRIRWDFIGIDENLCSLRHFGKLQQVFLGKDFQCQLCHRVTSQFSINNEKFQCSSKTDNTTHQWDINETGKHLIPTDGKMERTPLRSRINCRLAGLWHALACITRVIVGFWEIWFDSWRLWGWTCGVLWGKTRVGWGLSVLKGVRS